MLSRYMTEVCQTSRRFFNKKFMDKGIRYKIVISYM